MGEAQDLTSKQERQLQKAMEKLDADLTRGTLHAESVIGKTHRNIPYSSTVIKARSRLVYWRLWQTEIRTKREMSEARAALIQEVQWTNPPDFLTAPKMNEVRKELEKHEK